MLGGSPRKGAELIIGQTGSQRLHLAAWSAHVTSLLATSAAVVAARLSHESAVPTALQGAGHGLRAIAARLAQSPAAAPAVLRARRPLCQRNHRARSVKQDIRIPVHSHGTAPALVHSPHCSGSQKGSQRQQILSYARRHQARARAAQAHSEQHRATPSVVSMVTGGQGVAGSNPAVAT